MISFLRKTYLSLGRFRVLYILSVLELSLILSYSINNGYGLSHYDTLTYYSAFDTIITGKPDILRTPLYPLLIGGLQALFGKMISVPIVYILQSILFLFSIRWIGITLENITNNQRISYWFTAVYALYPGVLSFCGYMMTESIAISLISAVLYLTSEAYYKDSWKKAGLSGIVSILLWLLRPSMIFIPVLLAVFWEIILLVKKTTPKVASYGVVSSFFSIICLGIYATAFQYVYQRPGVTAISTWNDYVTLRQAEAINVSEIDSQLLKLTMDSIFEANGSEGGSLNGAWWIESDSLHHKLTPSEFYEFVSTQKKKHLRELIKYIYMERFNNVVKSDCIFSGETNLYEPNLHPKIRSFTRLVRLNNGSSFLIFFIGIIILISWNIKERKVSFFLGLIFSIFAANYFTILIGAPSEYPRLLAQNYPVLIAVSCWVFDKLVYLSTLRPSNI